MATALDLITAAYSDLGVTGTGQTLTAAQSTQGFLTFNRMLNALGGQRNFMFTVVRLVTPLVSGPYQYQIGPSATQPTGYGPAIVQDRPVTIQRWGMLLATAGSPPIELPHRRALTANEYAAIPIKTIPSTFPTALYYDYQSPNGVLTYWPVPMQAGNSAVLYYPQNIDAAPSLTTQLQFPPGYEEAFEYLLALRLAPKTGRPIPEGMATLIREAAAFLKSRNIYVPELQVPFARTHAGGYNYLTDQII